MFASVAIAVPLRQLFVYKIPDGMSVDVGSRVFVPFGRRRVVGYVMDVASKVTGQQGQQGKKEIEIKEISEVADEEPVFSPKMVELIKWMADYYCVGIGEMCRTALPAQFTKEAGRKKQVIIPKETSIDEAFLSAPEVRLSDSQKKAYEELRFKVQGSRFNVTLLHGITGSGKTEIYLRLFEDVLKAGRQAVFLVPEIGMTPQSVGRLVSRFGNLAAVYHSGLTDARRAHEWRRMRAGETKIVIGTRSAIFAPFKNLGLIVLDEEHDPSYKQDENPRYNGRDTAVMRAKLENIPCLLASATPSLESFHNVKIKKYHYIHLPDRPTGAGLPDVELVDMKDVPKGANLSPRLINAISSALQKKEQVILYLNRRGFASTVICGDCGRAFACPNCSIALTYHRRDKFLLCHYCDFKIPHPDFCEKCKGTHLKALGEGTEKIEDEITSLFPSAKIARLDRDSASKAGVRPKILSEMKKGATDILIGTQMITKGHDFPNVTLVGVLSADTSLNFPDFRAPERTFQLITQVAGRSGRSDKKGKVVVQTYSPGHYAIRSAAAHDFFGFFSDEISFRRELSYPPLGRLALIRVQGLKETAVERYAREMFSVLLRVTSHESRVTLLGPAPAPLARIRNKARWHMLVKASDIAGIRYAVERLGGLKDKPPRGIKVIVDVDPVNML